MIDILLLILEFGRLSKEEQIKRIKENPKIKQWVSIIKFLTVVITFFNFIFKIFFNNKIVRIITMIIVIGLMTYEVMEDFDYVEITLISYLGFMFLLDLFNFELNEKRLKLFTYIGYLLMGIPLIIFFIDEKMGESLSGLFGIGIYFFCFKLSKSFYKVYLSDKEVKDKNNNIISEDRYSFLGFYSFMLVFLSFGIYNSIVNLLDKI